MTPPIPASLAPLKIAWFRAIWLANLASNFGGLVQAVGAAWTMTSLTASAQMVALVQASLTLPIMLFSLPSGAVADSFDRRLVMLSAQLFMLAIATALAVCSWMGVLTPWLLLSFTFLIGCGTALNNPSWQASVGEMVPRADLPAAVALNSVGFNLTRSVGPAVGGAVVAAAGAGAAFVLTAIGYLPLIGVLLRWRREVAPNPLPRESLGMAMGAGLRYVAMSPNIARVLLRAFAFGFASVAVLALLPLIARDLEAGGPFTYGALLGAFGFGAVVAAFLGPRMRAALSAELIVRLAFLNFAGCAVVAAVSPTAWLTGVGLLFGGGAWVMALSLFNTSVQLSTPRWVLGRALALYQTAAFGGMALGSWLWGSLADARSLDAALFAAAATMVAGAAIGLAVRLPGPSELNFDPLNRWREPHVAVDVTARSGPIAIMAEYRIREVAIPEFLAVMAERHRIRRRDGARHWTLLRDLEDPELWYETFQTPTWTEYVRHNSRTTQADAGVGDAIRALHIGPDLPRVHRMIVRQTRGADPSPKAPVDFH